MIYECTLNIQMNIVNRIFALHIQMNIENLIYTGQSNEYCEYNLHWK